jgi:hypothetical protein
VGLPPESLSAQDTAPEAAMVGQHRLSFHWRTLVIDLLEKRRRLQSFGHAIGSIQYDLLLLVHQNLVPSPKP